MSGLNDKQERFCIEYLIDHNKTQAYIRAGYAKKNAEQGAARLYSNVKVNTRIAELEKAYHDKLGITIERVLEEQAKIAFSSINNHIEIGPDGSVQVKSFEDMTPEAIACIKKIKEKRVIKGSAKGGKEDDLVLECNFEFELHDKVGTLRDIAKALGMYTEKVELSGADGKPIQPLLLVLPEIDEAQERYEEQEVKGKK